MKLLLNKGRHPGFVGRQTVSRHTRNGGLLFFRFDGKDVAVALVNPRLSTLLALNVHPDHRGHGLGKAIVAFLACNFIRAIETRVAFFESCGYKPIGVMKQGRSLNTQIMVRGTLPALAGRLRTAMAV